MQDCMNSLFPPGQKDTSAEGIWVKKPAKFVVFMWRLVNSFSVLMLWGISTIDSCVLYGEEEESVSHLFFNCKFSREVLLEVYKATNQVIWKKSRILAKTSNWRDIMDGIQKFRKGAQLLEVPLGITRVISIAGEKQELEGKWAHTTCLWDLQRDHKGYSAQLWTAIRFFGQWIHGGSSYHYMGKSLQEVLAVTMVAADC